MKKQSIKLSHVGRRELEEGSRVNCHNELFFVLLPFFIGMGLSGCASSPLPPHCRQPGTLVEQPIGAAGASPSPRISRGGALFRTGWLRGLSLFHSIRSSYTGARRAPRGSCGRTVVGDEGSTWACFNDPAKPLRFGLYTNEEPATCDLQYSRAQYCCRCFCRRPKPNMNSSRSRGRNAASRVQICEEARKCHNNIPHQRR
jgi:hypothetical protein